MLKWFLPRETDFYDLFEKHIAIVVLCTQELLGSVTSGHEFVERARQIKDFEHQADLVTHQCIEELHRTFITPFQRDDIYRLISKMDDIIDLTEDIAGLIVIYKVQEMTPEIQELARILVHSAQKLQQVVAKLRHEHDRETMKELFLEISHLENSGDFIYLKAIGRLFEDFADTRLVIKWKEIYDNIENAIDSCKDAANIIEGVILESS